MRIENNKLLAAVNVIIYTLNKFLVVIIQLLFLKNQLSTNQMIFCKKYLSLW